MPAAANWSRTLITRLVVADAVCALVAVAIGFEVRIGLSDMRMYLANSAVLALGWLASLAVQGSYEIRRIATGTREYQKVIRAGAALAGESLSEAPPGRPGPAWRSRPRRRG